ncbi:MAG TPA: hypothetical protein DCZ95_07555 [Verrucomicrobia bacterium]|nr:MAG: hypothetical protein A2X46_01250 [Lentisphaerae bacterium GWF2_57_35]HBA83931.1 hypothetical protein [Verrucomicrobiota bacterium]
MSFSLFMMRIWSAPRAPRRLGEEARLINPVALRPNLGAARLARHSSASDAGLVGLQPAARRHAWMTMLRVAVATAFRLSR